MPSTLLIVSPQTSFGIPIRNGLDPARFEVLFTSDFSDAINVIRKTNCSTVLLDAELDDVELSVMDIGYALRQIRADLKFVIFTGPGQKLDSVALAPVATIVKPFLTSDILLLLEKLSSPLLSGKSMEAYMPEFQNPERIIEASSRQLWLTDVSRAAQQLTQLTLESAAQAAFITRENELWAYAGQLSRDAAQELTSSIQRYYNAEAESDLLRFVRLQATEAQHMLYVRKLSKDMNLALVFDAETPFSTIRSQAGKLVKNLFENAAEQPAAQRTSVANPNPVQLPEPVQLGSTNDQGHSSISDLLGEIPSPNPPDFAQRFSLPWEQHTVAPALQTPIVSETPRFPYTDDLLSKLPIPPLVTPVPVQTARSGFPTPQGTVSTQKRPLPAMDETFSSPAVPRVVEPIRGDFAPRQSESFDPQAAAETRAQILGEPSATGAHRIYLEGPSVSHVNLSYACLLIPRFETHHLIGDAALRLNEWVNQLCIAFGWRLEYIAIRPEYLQWIARVPLNNTAGYVINTIRKHTSERLFNEFPRFKADNPSGDFWAHGFIVQGGSQPHPQKLIQEFIQQTRMRQGLR